jgi:ATP-dependent helicase HrpB
MTSFPVDALIPDLLGTLSSQKVVLLQAPPGAGKTTRVPPALLEADWCAGQKVLMLEPRRLAARSAARFMAQARNESIGETVGYRVRLDSRVSSKTRIEVVTEGILTRMIQSDPALSGYAAVLFDEFHERSLHADLGLALVRESQQALREDLRIVVMSATLDTEPLARLLDDAPVLSASGRTYPVSLVYRQPSPQRSLIDHVVSTIFHSLSHDEGSVLVFLPGVGEIRRVAERLQDHLTDHVLLAPLYGDLSGPAQDAALDPVPAGKRKIVLATAIAESSLTIEGVRVVIDAGLQRRSRFDPGSGMSRLVTTRVSRASADQRAGRAGRLEPGVCYRLWSEGEQRGLPAFTPPEILEADLAGLVLELAHWGARSPDLLTWLDPPPAAHWDQARDLLQWLDAVDDSGGITQHGRAMRDLGLHPRLAHMIVRARDSGQGDLAAELAALLSERDVLVDRPGADLALRVRIMRSRARSGVHHARLAQVKKLVRALKIDHSGPPTGDEHIGSLLALAFPDRIAKRRGQHGRFLLSNGKGAVLSEQDSLASSPWLVAAELDGQGREARIFRGAAVEPEALERALADHIRDEQSADWDEQRGRVVARRFRKLGALVLQETELEQLDDSLAQAGLLAAVRRKGIDVLPWTETNRQWQARVMLLHALEPDDWPCVDDQHLAESLDHWLLPFLAGKRRWSDVQSLDLGSVLTSLLDHEQQQALGRLAPRALQIPTGRQVNIDYSAEGGPVLATKLQSLFGWTRTPTIAGGQVAIVLHLLSPAGRPLAVTADLASFWANAYPQVRKDMRGRYPKHPWPEDPLNAQAREGTKQK